MLTLLHLVLCSCCMRSFACANMLSVIGDAVPGAASVSGSGLVHSLLSYCIGTAGYEQEVPYY